MPLEKLNFREVEAILATLDYPDVDLEKAMKKLKKLKIDLSDPAGVERLRRLEQELTTPC